MTEGMRVKRQEKRTRVRKQENKNIQNERSRDKYEDKYGIRR